ncbi:hypothetical protein [Caloranaerobacter azorensis]|uniref:WD40 repeat domain-containing protein n=1 Tax=Caloranaerobacter azorensis TaxID=116090 RepID=A0A6P1YEM5_9FIRM|nr:hypothetical protein [Caloranaerobacter azorensis]QIB27720.1 hypothetical protein G3A45_10720 [Caloranaerobacter azorensis]
MKQVFKLGLLVFLIFLILLIGCSISKKKIDVDDLLNEEYFSNPYSICNYQENKDTLELNGIHISLKDNTIQIEKNKGMKNKIKINSSEEIGIEYVGLSFDKKYLVLEVGELYFYLNEIYIINLDNLRYKKVSVNQIDGTYTFIPCWSPNENILAFSFGDVSDLKPALFYLKDNKVKILTEKRLLNVLDIKWHKNGQYVDYAVEEESDLFAIYRYDLKKDKFYKLINLTRDELLLWCEIK